MTFLERPPNDSLSPHTGLMSMQPYGQPGRSQGVVGYEIGETFIRLEFGDGSIYRYDADNPGASDIEQMKALAARGEGLTTYVNKHVRKRYAKRER